MRNIKLITTTGLLGTGFVLGGLGLGTAGAATVEPQLVEDNPTCEQVLPGSIEHKLDFNPGDGEYTDGTITVTVSGGTESGLDWASDIDMDAVIMKGGPVANVYLYPGDADLADTELTTPINPNNDKPYGTSHVSFCYDLEIPDEPEDPGDEPEEPGDEPEEPETPETPEVEPEVEPEAEVLGVQLERPAPAQLPRTGASTVLLAATGVSLTGVGAVLRRLGRR